MTKRQKTTRLERFKKVYKKYHYIKDSDFIDVVFGTVFANRLDESPVWLYIVGPPSCGKTAIVQTLKKSQEIFMCSRIRPTSLASGMDSRSKTKNKKKKERRSLLTLLDGKVLVIKDFTVMLSMRYNDLMEVLGQLRNAYDGDSTTAFGSGQMSITSKFGVIACVTGAIDRHAKLVADLGERFITYRMPDISKYEESKRCMMAMSLESLSEKDQVLSKAALKVLEANPKPASISKRDRMKLYKICQVVSHARASVHRDHKTFEPEIPTPEAAVRLSEQLAGLARGVAMARERSRVTKEEVDLARTVAIHSITAKRLMLIKTLLSFWPDYVGLDKIIDGMRFKFSDMTVRRWMEEMLLLQLVERKTVLTAKGSTSHRWKLSDGKLLKDVLGE